MADERTRCFVAGKEFSDALANLYNLSELDMGELVSRFEPVAEVQPQGAERMAKDYVESFIDQLVPEECFPELEREIAELKYDMREAVARGDLGRLREPLEELEMRQDELEARL